MSNYVTITKEVFDLINEIIYKKVGEWEKKGSRQQLIKCIREWLDQFDNDEKPEMLTLLSHFDFYSEYNLKEQSILLYRKFRAICDSKDVVFSKTEKDIGTSFSTLFYTTFWRFNNIYHDCQENLSSIIDEPSLPQNIVIVDDFLGSGDTVIQYVSSLIQKNPALKYKSFFFLFIHSTIIGEKAINDFAHELGLTVTVISNKRTKKAFEEGNIYNECEADIHKKLYGSIFDKRSKLKWAKFGYKETEALVSFYYNTPNNTLGLFWINLSSFKSLFARQPKPYTSLSAIKNNREREAALSKEKPFVRDLENYKTDIFLVYCVAKGGSFDVLEACKDFGLTEKQLTELLDYLLEKNYLENLNGRFYPTEILKEHLYSSRVRKFKSVFNNLPQESKITETDCTYIPKGFKEVFSGYKNGGGEQ